MVLGEGPLFHLPSKASKVFSFPRSSFLPSALLLFLSRVTSGLRPGPCSFPSLLSSSQYLNIKSSLWALFSATKSASTTVAGSLWQTHQHGALPGAPRWHLSWFCFRTSQWFSALAAYLNHGGAFEKYYRSIRTDSQVVGVWRQRGHWVSGAFIGGCERTGEWCK